MKVFQAGLAACVALVIASCSSTSEPTTAESQPATTTATGSAPRGSALKPIDPAAFQAVVAAAAKELLVPGAMVVLRTPQGTSTRRSAPRAGRADAAGCGHSFPDRLEHQDHDCRADRAARPGRQTEVQRSGVAYVPNVPNGENITIAELLKMRSGLFNYTADPALSAASDADPTKVWTPQEVLDIAFRHPPQFAPDASYEYNNTNYALLGLIAEKAGGRPLAQQLQDRLFGPVGLTQTSLPAADDSSIPAPYSHGYMYGESHYALADEDPRIPPTCRPPHGPEP